MKKTKTLLDFFSRSPANRLFSNESAEKSESVRKDNITPKSKEIAQDSPVPSSKRLAGFSESFNSPNSTSSKKAKKRESSPRSQKQTTKRKDNFENGNSVSPDKSSDEENEERIQTSRLKSVKRRRIVIASESEDSDEYKPEVESDSSESDVEDYIAENNSGLSLKKREKSTKKDIPSLHVFKKAKKSLNGSCLSSPKSISIPSTPSSLSTPLSKQKSVKVKESKENPSTNEDCAKEYLHETLEWLQPKKIRDKSGKLGTDPMYNPRTLYVPDNFLNKTTPAMRQWWDLKSDHFDTVLFFKVGRFYELYHMDAVIGVKELGLIFMKGDFAHSGFPEMAFGRYSESLIEKGYKVARVEQTESPKMMAERCSKLSRPSKYDKVVAREICQITTKGTRTLTYQEENMNTGHNFLLAVCEKPVDGNETSSEYGICFIDTSIGKFTFGQFKDDRHRSRMLTLLALHPIVEILYEKASIRKKTSQLLNSNLSGIRKEAMSSKFFDYSEGLNSIRNSGYFNDENCVSGYPRTVYNMLDPGAMVESTPLKQYELAVMSLSACIRYLKECQIEDTLLSMKLFEEYSPPDEIQISSGKNSIDIHNHMVLDGITLQNLEIVPVLSSDSANGSLLSTMDHCSSSIGKRLFRSWLCSPLCNPEDISNRLDAIDDLANDSELVDITRRLLSSLPDLERLLSKIHAFSFPRSKDHPDSRATFYDSEIYNKRKLNDFLTTLEGFRTTINIVSNFKIPAENFKSTLLKKCTSLPKQNGNFPDLTEILEYFDDAFDHKIAKENGNIIPGPCVDEEFDKASRAVDLAIKALDVFIQKQKRALKCEISYVHSGKNRYMLELSEKTIVPHEYEFQGGRKGFKRYYTEDLKDCVDSLTKAEECRSEALENVTKNIFSKFDKHYEMWRTACQCIATLDVLVSLTLYYQTSGDMCRPVFSLPDSNNEPFLKIIDGKHPTFLTYSAGDDYIPNSIYIGPKQKQDVEHINSGGKVVLVTGPNMGGKSTLMRQAGTLVIMAQLGSYVPATSMSLTPVDRIFTRVGANDQINKGESTFFVEASETSSILHHATSNSFVLVDELGRGTATYDGTAIASAALKYLANDIQCRTLFSTHYHDLVDDFYLHSNVGLGHMACMVEKDLDCPSLEKITFLYKFINGACPKSYGFNCALLAGIPKNIVRHGFLKAQQEEYSTKILKVLRNLLSRQTPEEITSKLKSKGVI